MSHSDMWLGALTIALGGYILYDVYNSDMNGDKDGNSSWGW